MFGKLRRRKKERKKKSFYSRVYNQEFYSRRKCSFQGICGIVQELDPVAKLGEIADAVCDPLLTSGDKVVPTKEQLGGLQDKLVKTSPGHGHFIWGFLFLHLHIIENLFLLLTKSQPILTYNYKWFLNTNQVTKACLD